MFPTAFARVGIAFYRSKITSWMAAQEEDYRWCPQQRFAFYSPKPKSLEAGSGPCELVGDGHCCGRFSGQHNENASGLQSPELVCQLAGPLLCLGVHHDQ